MKDLELRNTQLSPLSFSRIPLCFPDLETISMRSEPWSSSRWNTGPFATEHGYMSDILLRLKRLHTFTLDFECLFYDISPFFGPSGVLHLGLLTKLRSLTVPLFSFVDKTSGVEYRLANPSTVLPQSLRRLTITTDDISLQAWRDRGSTQVQDAAAFEPERWLLQVLEMLCLQTRRGCFPHLAEIFHHWRSRGYERHSWDVCPGLARIHSQEPPSNGHEIRFCKFQAEVSVIKESFDRQGIFFATANAGDGL